MSTKHLLLKTVFKLLCISALSLPVLTLKAQVTIGSDKQPESGSLLELKEFDATADNVTSDRGMLYPRVKLLNKSELYPMYKSGDTYYNNNKNDLKRKHTGLTVFNVGEENNFTIGMHIWNGTEWRKVENNPVIQPQISSLICKSASMTPASYKENVYFEGILKIPYMGGNGGTYEKTDPISGTTTTNNLSIERIEGKLAYGGGDVMYRVFGTPKASSPVTATFPISFLGQNCNVTVGNLMSSVNIQSLESDILINSYYLPGGDRNNGTVIPFGEITIPETSSYAFSLRLYGTISQPYFGRIPFYIFLHKKKDSTITLLDAAELDMVTIDSKNSGKGTEYSYSVTLGGVFEEGDQVQISMHRINASAPTWYLMKGSDETTPVRTSLIYWKL